MEKTAKQQLYEDFVKIGFEPMRRFIEIKRLEEDLNEQDIRMVSQDIEHNLNSWIAWLRHQKQHLPQRGGME